MRRIIAVLVVLLLVLLLGVPAWAGVLLPSTSPGAPLKIRKEQITIRISNQVMQTVVDQVFENQTGAEVDATYVQRLPEGAAVSGFATWVGGKKIESRVEEKAAAAATYEKDRRAGGAPALLARSDKERFSMRVARIPAGQTRRIEVRYEGILDYRSGTISLGVPLKPDGMAVPRDELTVAVEIVDSKEISGVRSTTLPVQTERVSSNRWRVRYQTRAVAPARDLELRYDVRSRDLGLTFLTHRTAGDDGYFMLIAAPQELTQDRDIVKKDVVFVYDTSGSMMGEKIRQTRGALKKCLAHMNTGDRFGIVAFSDAISPFRSTLQPLTPTVARDAEAFVERLDPTGGTNIHLALTEGMKLLADSDGSERPKVIIFLTDGQPTAGVTDSEAILSAVESQNAKRRARIFTFGVGADVNRTLLERLGREQRGAVDFIQTGVDLEQTVAAFYAKIARPVLADLAIAFGTVTTAMTYPNVLPDLYKGSQLLLVGRYRGQGTMKARLTGALNGASKRYGFEAVFPAESQDHGFLPRLWAQRRVDYLLAQQRMHGEASELRAEVVRLGTRYHIATPYTSLVASAPEARVASLSPARVKPGDPEIRIRAPQDARAVTVVFPFGVTKAARFEPDLELWTVRFLIPRGTPDGSYPVTVLVALADGTQQTHSVSYTVDTAAPTFKLALSGALVPGAVLTLTAHQIITVRELRQAPGYEPRRASRIRRLYAQMMADVRAVTVRLPGGELMKLQRRADDTWQGQWTVPDGLVPGGHALEVLATDLAGNRSSSRQPITVSR